MFSRSPKSNDTESNRSGSRSEWVAVLEKTTELQFFLHLLCITIYAEFAIKKSLGRSVWELTNADLREIHYGYLLVWIVGYLALMGFLFPMTHALLRTVARCSSLFSSAQHSSWGNIYGWVHGTEVLMAAYKSKDYAPFHAFEAHRRSCALERKKLRQLSGLALASLIIVMLVRLISNGGYFWAAYTWVEILFGDFAAAALLGVFLCPLALLIYADLQDQREREDYLFFPPLYQQLNKPVLGDFPKIEECGR